MLLCAPHLIVFAFALLASNTNLTVESANDGMGEEVGLEVVAVLSKFAKLCLPCPGEPEAQRRHEKEACLAGFDLVDSPQRIWASAQGNGFARRIGRLSLEMWVRRTVNPVEVPDTICLIIDINGNSQAYPT